MKKSTLKKLSLCRETLRFLTDEQARLAEGGAAYQPKIPPTSDSERICCA